MPKLIRWFVVIKGNKLNRLTMRTFKNQMQAFAIKQLLKYVERDPEVNAAKALKIIRKIDLDGTYGSSWDELEKCLQDPGNNWTRLVKRLIRNGIRMSGKTIRIPDM
jgi:hypothetical protein